MVTEETWLIRSLEKKTGIKYRFGLIKKFREKGEKQQKKTLHMIKYKVKRKKE